ncbi:glycosyltransferase family 4 protein [Planococcus sp. SE5232]|uniref:glycosyltransferase family 4 protein n=1 Tax=unclassified Planococcus (in: firmicutes) TaxID=2662419 RepID=UPI003D6A204B
MKILWLTNIPSPYRVDFFNELGSQCELTVLFEKSTSSERDTSWANFHFHKFTGVILKNISMGSDKALSLEQLKYIKNEMFDHIIVSNPFTLTGIITTHFMRMKNISFSIVSDGGMSKYENKFKIAFKTKVLKGATFYFSTAKSHDEYYMKYGVNIEKIVRYPFTSLHTEDILEKPINISDKNILKDQLNIKEEKVILSVGRFIPSKGIDVLLKSFKGMPDNYGLYVIGGEATQDYTEMKKKLELTNVHFHGFKNKHELKEYYMLSDLFVLPTRGDIWGLVINEAMAAGLPIITTDKCVAGVELIEEEINGYIVPVDNTIEMNRLIKKVLNDNVLREKIAKNNLEKIREYTIQKMVNKHITIFNALLGVNNK